METSRHRLNSFKTLPAGWYDGNGEMPPHDGLDWFADWLDAQEAAGLPLSYIYPDPEGGVQIAWDTPPEAPCNVELNVNLSEKTGFGLGPVDWELDLDLTDTTAVAEWRAAVIGMGILGRVTAEVRALAESSGGLLP